VTNVALKSLRALERLYTRKVVQSPPTEEPLALWVGTSLAIADDPLLVGEGELEEIIETPPVVAIPGTRPWVLGVASHMGGLLPVLSGDVFFRKTPYAGRVREYCMVVRRQGFNFAMTLSAVQRDMKFPLDSRDMEHPVDADFAEFSLGGFHNMADFLAILDIDKLVADEEFGNAAATSVARH
jgi:twitching motility protein PilI